MIMLLTVSGLINKYDPSHKNEVTITVTVVPQGPFEIFIDANGGSNEASASLPMTPS